MPYAAVCRKVIKTQKTVEVEQIEWIDEVDLWRHYSKFFLHTCTNVLDSRQMQKSGWVQDQDQHFVDVHGVVTMWSSSLLPF